MRIKKKLFMYGEQASVALDYIEIIHTTKDRCDLANQVISSARKESLLLWLSAHKYTACDMYRYWVSRNWTMVLIAHKKYIARKGYEYEDKTKSIWDQ